MLAERGFGGIGLTAREVDAAPPRDLRRLLGAYGLQATSLNSAGYVLHADAAAARRQAELDARLFAAAAELDAPVNFIPGGLLHAAAGMPLADARARVADGLARLAERAQREGVRLALEPFHPMAIGPRGCINQISAALAAIEPFPWIGLTLDLHHSWWDADLEQLMSDHAQRVMLIQICGIDLPADGGVPRRAELGAAGSQEVRRILRLAAQAGHAGGIEYEVFHDQLGAPDIEDLLDRAAADLLALTE
ncbi:sugar phosphate isomerase/epimerase family protein [Neoroseomonas rubea]|uniref:sugar phosphate isomerase/epimerase family protein n=1 Tax=Neoroseomonas rubea TaxID=2748666 RepID=UPI0018E03B16|nr:TIM barrel protein [Roseomonas rubea]